MQRPPVRGFQNIPGTGPTTYSQIKGQLRANNYGMLGTIANDYQLPEGQRKPSMASNLTPQRMPGVPFRQYPQFPNQSAPMMPPGWDVPMGDTIQPDPRFNPGAAPMNPQKMWNPEMQDPYEDPDWDMLYRNLRGIGIFSR